MAACQRIDPDLPWPQLRDAAISMEDARAAVAAFREIWVSAVLPTADDAARTLAPCMTSDRDYYVGRVEGADAARRIHEGRPIVLWGSIDALQHCTVAWEVEFAGGSDALPPAGMYAGFLTLGRELLVIVQWPEG